MQRRCVFLQMSLWREIYSKLIMGRIGTRNKNYSNLLSSSIEYECSLPVETVPILSDREHAGAEKRFPSSSIDVSSRA